MESLTIKKRFKHQIKEKELIQNYYNISIVYQLLFLYQDAIEVKNVYKNLMKGLALIDQDTNQYQLLKANGYFYLAECYYKKNDYMNASKYYQRCYQIRQKNYGVNNEKNISLLNSYGRSLYFLNRKKDAKEVYLKILKALEVMCKQDQKFNNTLITTKNNIGTIYIQLQDYVMGRKYLNQALQICTDSTLCQKLRRNLQMIQEKIKT